MGHFLYSQCSHNPEFADATLQGAQIKQKSLTATSSAVWSKGALTLKISMIWTRYAEDYPRSSCGCHQNSFLFGQGNKQGRLRHSSVCIIHASMEEIPSQNYVSVQGCSRLLPPVILQGSGIRQKGLTATSSALWSGSGLTWFQSNWIVRIANSEAPSFLWGHTSTKPLDSVRKTAVGSKESMGHFLYSQCSHNPEVADATLQGAQIKQKSLTATSTAVWSKGALTLKISMIWTRYAEDYPRSICGCHQSSFFLDRATSKAVWDIPQLV